MKIFKYITMLAIFILLSNCGSSVAYFPTSEVSYQDYSNDVLTVRVLGYGLDEASATQDAQMRALETLFFRGIPNSNINKPLIGINEMSIKERNKAYFKEFFGYKRFLTFISSTNFIAAQKQKVIGTKIKNKKFKEDMVNAIIVATDVSINVKPLRKDLEMNKVIRKFGY